jgi:hypothetical protein
MTKEIIVAAKRLDIAVHDHIIIGRKGHSSMKGLLLIQVARDMIRRCSERPIEPGRSNRMQKIRLHNLFAGKLKIVQSWKE